MFFSPAETRHHSHLLGPHALRLRPGQRGRARRRPVDWAGARAASAAPERLPEERPGPPQAQEAEGGAAIAGGAAPPPPTHHPKTPPLLAAILNDSHRACSRPEAANHCHGPLWRVSPTQGSRLTQVCVCVCVRVCWELLCFYSEGKGGRAASSAASAVLLDSDGAFGLSLMSVLIFSASLKFSRNKLLIWVCFFKFQLHLCAHLSFKGKCNLFWNSAFKQRRTRVSVS